MSHNEETNSSSSNSDTQQTNLAIPPGLLHNPNFQSTLAPSEPKSVITNNENINITSSIEDTLICHEIIEAPNDANINNPNDPNSTSISISNTTNLSQSNSNDLYDINSINIFEIILDHPQAMNKPVSDKLKSMKLFREDSLLAQKNWAYEIVINVMAGLLKLKKCSSYNPQLGVHHGIYQGC